MKLKASASATFLFRDTGIQDIARQASHSGFDALEFQLLRPGDAARFAPAMAATGLECALINFGVGDLTANGWGLSGVPGRTSDFIIALENAYEDAHTLAAKVVHVGPSRIPSGMHRDRCIAQLIDNLRRALDRFSSLDVVLSIEALNSRDFPGMLIGSPNEALEVIDRIGGDKRLMLQYDIYHAAMDGRDILRDLSSCISKVGHIQFADSPGRHEPGTGGVDIRSCFSLLRSLEYRGYVGAEYVPSREVGTTLQWMTLL